MEQHAVCITMFVCGTPHCQWCYLLSVAVHCFHWFHFLWFHRRCDSVFGCCRLQWPSSLSVEHLIEFINFLEQVLCMPDFLMFVANQLQCEAPHFFHVRSQRTMMRSSSFSEYGFEFFLVVLTVFHFFNFSVLHVARASFGVRYFVFVFVFYWSISVMLFIAQFSCYSARFSRSR